MSNATPFRAILKLFSRTFFITSQLSEYRNLLLKAWLETTGLRRPDIFWYPLTKATSLGLLGRIGEGKRYATELLQLKPDFRERGRRLLRRYIKFDYIADCVIEGLNKVGIEID